MPNKSKIITPESSLKQLVDTFDQVLVLLDEASEHFIGTVLNKDDLTEDVKKLEDKEKIKDLMSLLENYALMSGFLIDHPLITVIKQIRSESKVSDTNPTVMAINTHIEVGQYWKHYKGTTYKIVSVAKNANCPTIQDIHYADQMGKTWSLPIHEFIKTVMHEGKEVHRFWFEH